MCKITTPAHQWSRHFSLVFEATFFTPFVNHISISIHPNGWCWWDLNLCTFTNKSHTLPLCITCWDFTTLWQLSNVVSFNFTLFGKPSRLVDMSSVWCVSSSQGGAEILQLVAPSCGHLWHYCHLIQSFSHNAYIWKLSLIIPFKLHLESYSRLIMVFWYKHLLALALILKLVTPHVDNININCLSSHLSRFDCPIPWTLFGKAMENW